MRLVDHGGVCDGVSDNSAALARALARARQLRLPVLVPDGPCAYADVIRVDGVTLTGSGPGSVLHALDWRRSAIFMSGAAPVVSHLRLTGAAAPSRRADWEMTRITVFGATDFVIDHVAIDGAAAAGIQTARGATRGRITNNVVRNTLSDGIHLTDGASHILVEGNLVESAGDDGIAVVSYRDDQVRVSHVTARRNVVRNNRWGRNMSVVGGEHVLYEDNLLQNNLAGWACLYIAQDGGDLATKGSRDVLARRNTLEQCGGVFTSHGAAMVFSAGQEANVRISLLDNDVRHPRRVGIRVVGPSSDVLLQSNRVTDAMWPLDVRDPAVRVIPYAGGPVGPAAR
ncbi:right-handed parallel beta-helix repeat-containing protein [Ramlibacter tataouinensis]|uniref:right-handed parallel beta-helix repeat-containing protein n=1 Tax=Ramlibacter tataouinensis TaxID=94132 RepID=UPI0022F3B97F|nr:right-handed parallel beta-helix repeat-containing protein [Ramlibacter tataouinensis]WBY00792.1 right-handed parallel beta-helix repeat-containing protein [Ramlibacter tataouinensis]